MDTPMPPWVARYVGIPFRDHGRDRAGLDCWGCLYLVLREQFGLLVPSYAESYQAALQPPGVEGALRRELATDLWRAVPRADARLGDGLLLRLNGVPLHVGLYLAEERFLHAAPELGVVVDRLDSPRWARRLLGVYRYTA